MRRRTLLAVEQKKMEEIHMSEEEKINGVLQKWYADGGETEFTGKAATVSRTLYVIESEKTFSEDTKLLITVSSSVRVYDGFTFSSSDGEINYYAEQQGTWLWYATGIPEKTMEYVVRAGYRFRMVSYASTIGSFSIKVVG